jgi:hypothetical protein
MMVAPGLVVMLHQDADLVAIVDGALALEAHVLPPPELHRGVKAFPQFRQEYRGKQATKYKVGQPKT